MAEIGLVGAPSSGKSTFFKSCTLKDVKIAPYPFTTLEPNEGLAYATAECACMHFRERCKKCHSGIRFIPIKLWDVAGLVPDAHMGKGRGNAFLSDVMRSDALIHVLDVSGSVDYEGNPAEGFDPLLTVEMLEKEIDFWMMSLLKKDWKLMESSKDASSLIEKRLSGLGIRKGDIDVSMQGNPKTWSEAEILHFVSEVRKRSKPIIIAGNKYDRKGAEENRKRIEKTHQIVPASAEVELALREASKEGAVEYVPGSSSFKILRDVAGRQKQALEFIRMYLEKNGNTGVQQCLDKTVFDVLEMSAVYPVEDEKRWTNKKGEMLPDAFLMRKGATALDLAFRVHEDIGKKFISAVNAKTGRNIAADYVLQDGDVISIKAGR